MIDTTGMIILTRKQMLDFCVQDDMNETAQNTYVFKLLSRFRDGRPLWYGAVQCRGPVAYSNRF